MVNNSRRYQGGSVVSFIITAVAIAALLFAGVFILRQRGEQARQDQPVAVTEPQPSTLPGGSTSQSDKTPADEKNKTREQTEAGANGAGSNSSAAESQRSESAGSQSAPAALPSTGPKSIAAVAIVALIGFVAASYMVSRRDLYRVTSSL